METITSRTNPLCTHLRKLAASASYRRSCGEFLCDSPKLLEEALLWGADLHTVVCTDPSALLDGVQDPGNVGTILRTADAFRADGLFLVNACADLYNPKTVRASMGAVFRCPVWSCTLSELRALLTKSGLPLYGAALRADTVDGRRADFARCAVASGSPS